MQARATARLQMGLAKRVSKELEKINNEKNMIAKLKNDEDINKIIIQITPPEDRPFRNQIHFLEMQLTYTKNGKTYAYPADPPLVLFRTKIYHPNIGGFNTQAFSDRSDKADIGYSVICLDILKEGDKWTPTNSLVTVVYNIFALLDDPNPSSPLNSTAACLWRDCEKKYMLLCKDSGANRKTITEINAIRENCFKEYQKAAYNAYISEKKYYEYYFELMKPIESLLAEMVKLKL